MQQIKNNIQEYINSLPEEQRLTALTELAHFTAGLIPNAGKQPIARVWFVPYNMVVANDYNPNAVAVKEMQLLEHSILRDGYCVEESTPILKADLTWVKAGELKQGDKIIAFDEEATKNQYTPNARLNRKYRTSEVINNFVESSELLKVSSDRGDILVTPDHPFLAKVCYGKGHHPPTWVEAKDLKPDDIIIHLMNTWEYDTSRDAGWLAGFLDGEGTMAANQNKNRTQQTYRLSGYQRPSFTADKMILEMSKRAVTKVFVQPHAKANWNDMVMVRVDRISEIMRLLGSVRPERLIEAGGDFWEGMAIVSSTKGANDAYVRSVTKAGIGNIARLSTTTKTYIANGFAVHNTQPVVTMWDEERQLYIIVDGFHRTTVMKTSHKVQEMTGGLLPIVVIDKDINDRMAATVRHNRARGSHSIDGMSTIVFNMLDNGWTDDAICNEMGMEADELVRLKHITGFSKLFENAEYSEEWKNKSQLLLEKKYKEDELARNSNK